MFTTTGILFFLKRAAFSVWDRKVWFLAGLCLLLLIFFFRGCFRAAPAKLDQKEIQQIQETIAAGDRQKMADKLTELEVREKAIDANVAEGRKETLDAVIESRKKNADLTNEQIAAELERRANQ